MKCAKCGADCDSRQLFCLRCGTPLNGNKSEEEVIKEVEVPIEDMVDAISIDEEDDDIDLIIGRDLSRARDKNNINHSNGFKYKGTYNEDKVLENQERARTPRSNVNNARAKSRPSTGPNTSKNNNSASGNKRKPDSDKKKKIIIGASIGAAALIIVIAVLVFFLKGSGNFSEYYQNGINLYEKGKVEASITQFVKAADVAGSDDEKLDAYVMLWKAYSQVDGYEIEEIEVLKNLIELEPDNETYYQALITLYQDMDNQDAIDALIASVSDTELKNTLLKFDGTTPVATIAAGEYDKPISVGLTAAAGSTIYYTINGGAPTSSSNVYTGSIELEEEGEYTIKAVGIDSEGNESKQFEGRYILNFGTVNPPVVSLDSGTYNERKKVTVTADEGCTVYYTTDGTIPTKESKEYTKAFKIPENNTVYYFVAIDAKGVSSDVVTRVYDYKKIYAYDYNGAVSGLTNILISKGIMENTFGSYEDGSAMYFEYESIETIDKNDYYIIKATKESEEGKTVSEERYAFGCDNGMSYKVNYTGGKYELSEIE